MREVMITGTNDYILAENGTVTNIRTDKELKSYLNVGGYPIIQIKLADGKRKTLTLHKILADAFIENPEGYSVIHHIDFDKSNYALDNLQYLTHAQHMAIHNKFNNRYTDELVEEIVREYIKTDENTISELSKKYRIPTSTINCWLIGINRKAVYNRVHNIKEEKKIRKSKFSPEFKIEATKEYINGTISAKECGIKYNVCVTSIRNWTKIILESK